MKIDVVNIKGEQTGRSVELPEDIFGVEPNEHAVYLAVKQYLAHQRQGTHKAKERGEVAGATRKLHRQKGTGGSRKGDIKNPLFRGGGRIFGPRPRNYTIRLNKKVKRLAKPAPVLVRWLLPAGWWLVGLAKLCVPKGYRLFRYFFGPFFC